MVSNLEFVIEEIDKQAALATSILEEMSDAAATRTLPGAILDLLGHYSAALYIAERVVESDSFSPEMIRALHSKLLPLERMADDMIANARERGHYSDPEIAEPMRWLDTCNEELKDCMVALESILDPESDSLLDAAMNEHRRGETVSIESIH